MRIVCGLCCLLIASCSNNTPTDNPGAPIQKVQGKNVPPSFGAPGENGEGAPKMSGPPKLPGRK